ncbi:MAG TPA: amidohydrolase family protein [Acidimicrobiales bacterium]|nr:amidohydrolase family protein [Acidimicrobiales bacterium]
MALTVVDVDSHVYEPEAIWGDYLPDGVRDRARRAFSRQNGTVVLNGAPVTLPRVNRHAAFRPGLTPDDIGHADPAAPPAPNPGAWDAAARLADMDALGVAHAVVLPTLFAEYLPAVDDAELATALARAYNDWAVDLAGAGEGRLHPAAVVALHDPLAAAKEVARAAGRGLRAVAVRPAFQRVEGHAPTAAFGGAGDVNPVGIFVDDPAFAPLWQSIADHGLVACVHPALGLHNAEGTSAGPFLERVAARLGVGHTVTEPVAYMQDIATFVVSVAFHGLLEDYPELKLALLHGGASIVPLALEKAETYLWLSPQSVFAQSAPVSLEPADVWDAHATLVSFDGWESSAARLPEYFARKGAWGSRYPHHDASTPAEAIALLERYAVPGDIAEAMLGGNAAALFGLA